MSQTCPEEILIKHDPPQVYDLKNDPYEMYPLKQEDVKVSEMLAKAKEIVSRHKGTIKKVKDQLGEFNIGLVPCCSGKMEDCSCDKYSDPPRLYHQDLNSILRVPRNSSSDY